MHGFFVIVFLCSDMCVAYLHFVVVLPLPTTTHTSYSFLSLSNKRGDKHTFVWLFVAVFPSVFISPIVCLCLFCNSLSLSFSGIQAIYVKNGSLQIGEKRKSMFDLSTAECILLFLFYSILYINCIHFVLFNQSYY